MPGNVPTECPECGKATQTVFGRCPNCGYAKNPEAAPYSESYIARGPGSGLGVVGPFVVAAVPGLAIAFLGLLVFDSVTLALIGAVILVLGPMVFFALGGSDGL